MRRLPVFYIDSMKFKVKFKKRPMEIKTLQIKTMLALTPICQAQCDKIRFMLTDHDMIDK